VDINVFGPDVSILDFFGQVNDLHRHHVDDITIPSREGRGVLKRVEDVSSFQPTFRVP
jgi:hypothetical protein